ncbi:MAG: HAD family hydrolase [Oscillospiraceae bacterium]|jgi:putative hydrolase of the HAD superfamily|nr:HAD family hydrolase [Oscillospiraceae bacterium]
MNALLFDLFNTLTALESSPSEHEKNVLGLTQNEWEAIVWGDRNLYDARARGHLHTPMSIIEQFALRTNRKYSNADLREMLRIRTQRFRATLMEPPQEVLDTLRLLKRQGYALALVSNADVLDIQYWKSSKLSKLFDTAVFSCNCGYVKPEKEIYQLAISALSGATAPAVYIGDGGNREFEGAKMLGMKSVQTTQFLTGLSVSAKQAPFIDKTIRHIAALPGVLETL